MSRRDHDPFAPHDEATAAAAKTTKGTAPRKRGAKKIGAAKKQAAKRDAGKKQPARKTAAAAKTTKGTARTQGMRGGRSNG